MPVEVDEPVEAVAPTREAIDAAHERNGTAPPVIPGQQDIDGGEVPEPVAPVEELRVDGTTQLGLFDAGGKRPGSASLRLTGGTFELVEGQAFLKGDVIRFEGTAVVYEVAVRDKHDRETGLVVSAEQRHVARIVDLEVMPE